MIRSKLSVMSIAARRWKQKGLKKKFEKYFNKKLKLENLSKELEEEILIYLLRRP
jgi:hypothetical protein